MHVNKSPLILILVLVIIAVLIDMPRGIPVKFSLGPVKIDRVTAPPTLTIPSLGIDKEFTTHLGLDLQGGTQLVLEADMKDIASSERNRALEGIQEVVERRVNFFGVAEPVIQTAQVSESYRVIVELPGVKDVDQAVETLGQTARLELREIDETASPAGIFITPETTKPIGITGKELKKAEVVFDPTSGKPQVAFELTDEGARIFAEVTKRLIGKQLPIFLDDLPVSAPVVTNEIPDGKGVISSETFTREEARQLALQLSAGALPTPIKVIEQRTVGATLGRESVETSIRAGLLGLFLVTLFMVMYYGKLGLIADAALVIYGLLTYGLFRLIPVTLTLPGIAGFILSIGMAVDSNILIFERMKEEIRKGKPWQIAMELGFGKAWDSIRDANFTTLLTAFILYNPLNWAFLPASGMVRGFALTLAVGVGTSLFTGIVVTRNFMRAFYRQKKREA